MLRAGALLYEEDGTQVSVEEARAAYEEWADLIQYFDDLDSSAIVMTQEEYDTMPEIILQARRIFKSELQTYREQHTRRE